MIAQRKFLYVIFTVDSCTALRFLSETLESTSEKFAPVTYEPNLGEATIPQRKCGKNSYKPSALEALFSARANELTRNATNMCGHLLDHITPWLDQTAGNSPMETEGHLFSQICKSGTDVQLIEPLAGILRDPRMFCQGESSVSSTSFIHLADKSMLQGGKNILFDAGGTRFTHAMHYFTRAYEQRGIVFDQIYVWEARKQNEGAYWQGVSLEEQARWRPKLTFYNGVPVSAQKGHKDNVVEQILHRCQPQDFCSFKLDIDTPSIETSLVKQLLEHSTETSAKLDEFFFEHHVHGLMQKKGWGAVDGTFQDSYNIFAQLRTLGVRAHSWI